MAALKLARNGIAACSILRGSGSFQSLFSSGTSNGFKQSEILLRRSSQISGASWAMHSFFSLSQRSFATRSIKVSNFMSSPGILVEPYKPPPPPLPIIKRWFTREGWRIRKNKFVDLLKSGYALAKLRQKHKGYSHKAFYRDATDVYKEVSVLAAKNDAMRIRRLVTEQYYPVLRSQMKQREAAYHRVHFEFVGPLKRIKTLQARMIAMDQKDLNNAFVQVTVRVQSHQIFAAYDKKDKLIAGDPVKPILVEEIWVLEKHLVRPESIWRLCTIIKT